MPLLRRFLPHVWILTLCLAVGFLIWINVTRIDRIEQLSALSGSAKPAIDAASPTGYAGGVRMLIAPGHNNESYQWIVQTQQMLENDQWRLRHVDYDNAPIGRAVTSPSLYRWWLAAVAWGDRHLSGRSFGLSVEHGALWADPLSLMLLLVGGTILAARRFSAWSAALFPLAAVTLYPFSGAFLPGAPDDPGLALVLIAACLLALVGAALCKESDRKAAVGWTILSGIFGGIGMWLNVRTFTPVLIGVGIGGLFSAWITRRTPIMLLPWRAWSFTGALTTLLAWLIEFAPSSFNLSGFKLTEVHPFYALGWLGGGELLLRGSAWLRSGQKAPSRKELVAIGLAIVALAIVPFVMYVNNTRGFLTENTFALRLSAMHPETVARNFAAWMVREGASLRLLATAVALVLLVAGLFAFLRSKTDPHKRNALGLIIGGSVVAFGFACAQLSWWNQLDALMLVLLVTLAAGSSVAANPKPPAVRWLAWPFATFLVMIPGLILLMPSGASPSASAAFTKAQLVGLAERDFAHWLARRTGPAGAIALAPPDLTASLIFHGGLRGVGSPFRENEEGFRGSVRLAAATHADEAYALARQRNLTHIIVPSWEGFLDEYARLGAGQKIEHTLMGMLHRWLPPRWLKPVPYYLPRMKEFEDDRLLIFETTEVQDDASSLSRLTEYFLDMGQIELASLAAQTLAADYAADLGAQVAKARTEIARRDRAALEESVKAITAGLQDPSNDSLAWDQRVSLALVLAEAGRIQPARTQMVRCLDDIGELEIRGLSESTLFRFLSLCKVLNLTIEDPNLFALAKTLLPVALREQI